MRKPGVALALDVIVVLVFCIIGRSSHDEGLTFGGIVSTAWPFIVGLAVGWALVVALYRDKFDAFSVIPTGIVVWISTVVIGMILRVIGGQGTEFSFIVVATIFTGLFLLGWRGILRVVVSRRQA